MKWKCTASTLAVYLLFAAALFAQALPPDPAVLQSLPLQRSSAQPEQVTVSKPSNQMPLLAQPVAPHRDWTPPASVGSKKNSPPAGDNKPAIPPR